MWEGCWSDEIIDARASCSILGLKDRDRGANEVKAQDLDQFGEHGAE